jgi:amino acid transporter
VATETAQERSDELAEFGYKQELDRSIGKFASFAAGVSYISILTGTFQLFFFGFAFGGPAYWWSWPLVFFGQVMVALCFAELAANYPSPARYTTGPSGWATPRSRGSAAG